MVIKIKGSTISNEVINMNIIEKLYHLVNDTNVNCELEGHVQTDYVYEKWIDYLEHLYNKFKCNINRELLIWFDDENVKQILINNLSLNNIGGVPVSKKIDLSSISTWFKNNTNIKTFNELELFKNITALISNAFYGCTELEEIDLSNITFLGASCFKNDTKLNIDINLQNLITLQNDVFSGCTSLTTVSNLGNLTSENCGTGIFSGCTSLQSVVLPQGFTIIKDGMFRGCTSLSEINIPASVTTINSQGLRNTAITEIDLSNITYLGAAALRDCKNLACDIYAPSLITLGGRAFQNCTSIKKVTSLGNITSLQKTTEGGFDAGTFDSCTLLEEVTLPNTLKTMYNTFDGCTNLKTIKGNPQLTIIGAKSFSMCSNLETVPDTLLGTSIVEIGDRAFTKCLKLNVTTLNLPNLITLGRSVFGGLTNLERVINLGNTITEFGFTRAHWGDYGGVGMFENCINLTDVNVPSTVTLFGEHAFFNCPKLKNINIPDSLIELGNGCFGQCTGLLDNILYFKNVRTVKSVLFRGSLINQIYFPLLTSVYAGFWRNYVSTDGAFAGAYNDPQKFQCNLFYLKLDDDVELSDGTFSHTEIINLIINNDTPPQIYVNTFAWATITNIWVPDASVNTYKNAQYWSELSSKIKSINDFPYIVNTETEYRTLQEGGDNNIYLIREYMT